MFLNSHNSTTNGQNEAQLVINTALLKAKLDELVSVGKSSLQTLSSHCQDSAYSTAAFLRSRETKKVKTMTMVLTRS
jgi:hypothetical protein